ncbi:homoserine dehydrogenase [Fulvivirga sp. 29W222]|uniref:Homoserine dehydrogenase n=1 Tax=Fulvivirga marina TaxID=2494733 RepID=A0A937KCI1_9BACT|nr:homoserine dehydrogenase [Fulvivirga marina]MBL6444995.1 homoserine dehydrogenase [Fulvivirga marina]
MSKYKIGLFGFGCVGQGLYKTLSENDTDAEIVKVCVKRKEKERSIDTDKITYDATEILNNENINIIVELIDDATAALEIVRAALKKGKAVVSANKKMVAENLDELIELQKQHNTPLLYEGAVCGSIPIIRNLEDYYSSEHIEEIKGIFNGSSNYILTKLFQEGKSYEEALHEAQVNGFAETDPTLDVGGFDPKFKLSIILQHAFGLRQHPEKIFNWGIQNITERDIAFAKERNLKIKLLAKANFDGKVLSTLVAPHFIDEHNPLYHVENEFNCVLINGKYANNQTMIGKGAGSLPTGLAVLSDVIALTQDYTYRYKSTDFTSGDSQTAEVYLSFNGIDDIDKNAFRSISESYTGSDHGYIIGKINLGTLQQLLNGSDRVNAIFTSGNQTEIEIPNMTYSYAN